MIYAPLRRIVIRLCFKVTYKVMISESSKGGYIRSRRTAVIIMPFENARCPCDPDPIDLDASSVAKKVNIRGEPASMITVETQVN